MDSTDMISPALRAATSIPSGQGIGGYRSPLEEVAAAGRRNGSSRNGKSSPHRPVPVHIDLMVCMLNENCAAVCLETTEDDVIQWLKSKKIKIIPASFKETMALANVAAWQ
jgi:hypothetical protein